MLYTNLKGLLLVLKFRTNASTFGNRNNAWFLASFCTSQKVPGQTNRAEWRRWGRPARGRGWGVRQLDVDSARVPEALSALQISALLLKLSSYMALKSELWSVLLQDDHVRIWGQGRTWSPQHFTP